LEETIEADSMVSTFRNRDDRRSETLLSSTDVSSLPSLRFVPRRIDVLLFDGSVELSDCSCFFSIGPSEISSTVVSISSSMFIGIGE